MFYRPFTGAVSISGTGNTLIQNVKWFLQGYLSYCMLRKQFTSGNISEVIVYKSISFQISLKGKLCRFSAQFEFVHQL